MKKCAKCAVLCSGSASSLRYLYESDPNYSSTYRVIGLLSSKKNASGLEYARRRSIETVVADFDEWRQDRGVTYGDLEARKDYFAIIAAAMEVWQPDFIILSGFMLLVTDPLYSKFKGRILNVHPALLSLEDEAGKRKYTGLNVVARAMTAGDPTGSTVHIVTREPDMGPIVAESEPLPYQAGDDPAVHQDRMKIACDGPAFAVALEKLLASDWRVT